MNPPGFGPDWVKLRGRQGFRDPQGFIWKRDMLHKDHWDVFRFQRQQSARSRFHRKAYMARRTKEQKQAMNSRHPYEGLEDSPLWRAVSRAVAKLVKNGDLEEKTARQYIVGYLAKTLADDGFEQVGELRTGQRVMRVVEVKPNGAAHHQNRNVA